MEKNILRQFLYKNKLKFNELEKSLNIRSNKLSYHLNNLVKKGILEKNKESYFLSKKAEQLIPYISNKNAVLPIILIHLGNIESCFLHQREKRPFKDKLGLPGGRLQVGESIKDSVKRIMKEKHNLQCNLFKINSISLEHVKDKNKKIYSFLLIFITAKTRDKLNLINIEDNKNKIISSDYKLLKSHLLYKNKIDIFHTLS